MTKVSKRMKECAYEFERAAIEAGFDFAKLTWQSAAWKAKEKQQLRVFAVDKNDKATLWKGGK